MNITTTNNRRNESRYYFDTGAEIGWRLRGSRYRCRKGWIKNRSVTGLSLVVEENSQPQTGQEIEIFHPDPRMRQICRVVRVIDTEGGCSVIGCLTRGLDE